MIIDCTLAHKILVIIYERATEIYSFYHIDDILHPHNTENIHSFVICQPNRSAFIRAKGQLALELNDSGNDSQKPGLKPEFA